MRKYNFKCNECEVKFFESQHSQRSTGYYDRNGKRISCPDGHEDVSFIPRKEIGANFAAFDSASPEEKSKMLKKRSREHYKKKVHDKAVAMDRNPEKYT